MPQNKLYIVAIVFGGFVENIHVYADLEDANADFDKLSEDIDPESDDLKLFEMSLKTLDADVIRSWFNEHPEA